MNDDVPVTETATPSLDGDHAPAVSTLYQLLEAMVRLTERNKGEHRLFERTLSETRDTLRRSFDGFAKLTQDAHQQLRKELHGEKRISLNLLNELLEIGQDLDQIVASRPRSEQYPNREAYLEALGRWADSIEVESRKVQDALRRHGIHPYDAIVGTPYNPALHERIGSKRVEGLGPLLVAEQQERGYASQQPEFVLRRPKIYVSE
jgi:molecular chaperone GrpE (heat shock protein)